MSLSSNVDGHSRPNLAKRFQGPVGPDPGTGASISSYGMDKFTSSWPTPPRPFGLEQFYRIPGPWNSQGAVYDDGGAQCPDSTSYSEPFHDTSLLSDSGTLDQTVLMSDSGYGTNASAVGDADRMHDTQNHSEDPAGYQIGVGQDAYSRETQAQSGRWPKGWEKNPSPRVPGAQNAEGKLICPTCKESVKTKSILK